MAEPLSKSTGGARRKTLANPQRPPHIRLTRQRRTSSMIERGAIPRMATIDEDLSSLERDIRQLKIEYDQFFGGGRKRPPSEIEWRIEQVIKRHGERAGELKMQQRFRYNNLTQTYAKYKDIFRKRTALKEEGRSQKHYGAAAKMIEAERAKAHPEPPPLAPVSRQEAPVTKRAVAAAASNATNAFRVVCSDPEHETENVDRLFNA